MVLGAALLGFFLISLDALIVTVALPDIGRSLGGGMSGLQWVVDGYTLVFAALMLSAGAVSDRIGARRAYGGGLVLFALASAACGLAPGLGALVAARLVQGGAAALMMPASLALVRQGFPDQAKRARAIAVWTVGGAVAVAAGPVLGGRSPPPWAGSGSSSSTCPRVCWRSPCSPGCPRPPAARATGHGQADHGRRRDGSTDVRSDRGR
ncbi:MFS transporter [Streptomyces rimosus]